MEKPRHEGRNERGGEPKAWEGTGRQRNRPMETVMASLSVAYCLYDKE